MTDDIPDHYRSFMKDWHRIELPPHANAHDIAAKCFIPPSSYFATAGSLWLETEAYVDAVKPLIAAEAIASPASQPSPEPPPLPPSGPPPLPPPLPEHVQPEEPARIDNDGD